MATTNPYQQTVEEAAEILDAIRRGDSDWVIDESLVPRLRAGLASALERVRRMERVCCAAARVASDGGAVTDGCGCEWCDLLAALRALDGEGT